MSSPEVLRSELIVWWVSPPVGHIAMNKNRSRCFPFLFYLFGAAPLHLGA
jgi:hypothetical protein